MIKRFFSQRRQEVAPAPAIPAGRRVYAIGDVHGEAAKLERLLADIAADSRQRGPADATLIFLGDLVDRGPRSAEVVDRVRCLTEGGEARCLLGNHEEMFLAALSRDPQALRAFCRVGGRETAISYGIAPEEFDRLDYDELGDRLRALVPPADVAFLERCEDLIDLGDYAFVHAGVRPGVALAAQRGTDLRWIREPFLSHRGAFDRVVVHGHTIDPEVVFRPNRIGIDTGAYAGGPLTALGLEGADRWVIQAL